MKTAIAPVSHEKCTALPDNGERAQRVAQAINLLLETVSPHERELIRRSCGIAESPTIAPRAGAVLGAVVHLFRQKRELTVPEIKQAVAAEGVTATPKEVYNALGYLARKGRIRKISNGRYHLVDYGVVVETADELDAQP